MTKKIFSLVFVLSLTIAPLASHAGFFDIFRIDRGYQNSAQVKTASTSTVGLKRGDRSDVVLQVQQALTAAKLYAGDLSGFIGAKTEAAIRAWQSSNGLPATGVLDAATTASILGRGPESVGGNRDGLECVGSSPQIMVTSPNGGESYEVGAQIEVTWETCNIPESAQIYITMGTSADGQGHTFLTIGGSGTTNDGSEMFTLPESYLAGTYYVSVFRAAPNYLRDYSDASFMIEEELACVPGNSGQWIRVLSPNGGEVYQVNESITVTWESCNVPENELLEINIFGIESDLVFGFLAENGTPNDGTEVITQNWPVGTYVIIVGTPATPGGFNSSVLAVSDQSDNFFSIDQEIVEADNAPLLFINSGSSHGIYEDSDGNSVASYSFLARIKNTSDQNIYIEDTCGPSAAGYSVKVERWVNNQATTINPERSACFVGFYGSGVSNFNLLEPGVERELTITYSFDPEVNFSNYGIIVDGVNYRTPSTTSVLTHLNIHPQSHPEANSWNDLVSDVIWVAD